MRWLESGVLQRLRLFGRLALVLIIVRVLLLPGLTAANPGLVSIHLALRGGFQYTGMLRHAEDVPQVHGCSVTRHGRQRSYTVSFNRVTLHKPSGRKSAPDTFMLTVHGFPSGSRYISSRHSSISLAVIVQGRPFLYEQRGTNTLAVRIDRSGRHGSVVAPRLVPAAGSRGRPVSLRATWNCTWLG